MRPYPAAVHKNRTLLLGLVSQKQSRERHKGRVNLERYSRPRMGDSSERCRRDAYMRQEAGEVLFRTQLRVCARLWRCVVCAEQEWKEGSNRIARTQRGSWCFWTQFPRRTPLFGTRRGSHYTELSAPTTKGLIWSSFATLMEVSFPSFFFFFVSALKVFGLLPSRSFFF